MIVVDTSRHQQSWRRCGVGVQRSVLVVMAVHLKGLQKFWLCGVHQMPAGRRNPFLFSLEKVEGGGEGVAGNPGKPGGRPSVSGDRQRVDYSLQVGTLQFCNVSNTNCDLKTTTCSSDFLLVILIRGGRHVWEGDGYGDGDGDRAFKRNTMILPRRTSKMPRSRRPTGCFDDTSDTHN